MTEPESPSDLEVERLIRASLDRDAERVDPRPLFERIMLEAHGGEPSRVVSASGRRRSRVLLRWAGLAAVAAGLFACVTLFWQDRKAFAKGETVVRDARQAHSMPIDRCYLVEVRRESSMVAELAPGLARFPSTRLWTRGDRFWVESANPDDRWAWGRDESNRIWVAFGPHTAMRMDADEVPERLNLYCNLHSLNVEQLLGDVLGKFDLSREASPSGADSSTIRVLARAREMIRLGPSVQAVELEVDAETRALRRMVVRRAWNGQTLATVTYSLAETDALDPAKYQVEGHLTDPSEIFTRDHLPQRRRELVTRWLGARPARWLRGLDQAPEK